MGIKQLSNDNLRKLPNEYGDVSVMRFVAGNYNYETRSIPGILEQLKWESLKKGGQIVDSKCFKKRPAASIPKKDLVLQLGM